MSLRKTAHTLGLRLTATVAAALVLLSGMTASVTFAEPSTEELKAQRQEAIDRQKELEALRDAEASTLDDLEAQKAVIEDQIAAQIEVIEINQQLIDQMDTEIADINYEIGEMQVAIADKEAQSRTRLDELRSRLRAISKTGTLTSMVQMLLSSADYTEYLIKSKAMERVTAHTEELITQLEAEMAAINKDRDAMEVKKTELNEKRRPLAELQAENHLKKQELEARYSERNAITDKLHQNIDKYNADIEHAKEEAAALQQLINESIGLGYGGNLSYGAGSMSRPSTCRLISSLYGPRWGVNHNGIDFCDSGCYGTPIFAAADGVVSYAGWYGGYGYTVIIDHGTDSNGNNVTTLYAHSSGLYVSQGEAVGAGQAIAAIGSTGDSTGPHLHFEVRLNGAAVDPIGYGYVSASDYIINESL